MEVESEPTLFFWLASLPLSLPLSFSLRPIFRFLKLSVLGYPTTLLVRPLTVSTSSGTSELQCTPWHWGIDIMDLRSFSNVLSLEWRRRNGFVTRNTNRDSPIAEEQKTWYWSYYRVTIVAMSPAFFQVWSALLGRESWVLEYWQPRNTCYRQRFCGSSISLASWKIRICTRMKQDLDDTEPMILCSHFKVSASSSILANIIRRRWSSSQLPLRSGKCPSSD